MGCDMLASFSVQHSWHIFLLQGYGFAWFRINQDSVREILRSFFQSQMYVDIVVLLAYFT